LASAARKNKNYGAKNEMNMNNNCRMLAPCIATKTA
jgi:hypothetical protein